MSAIFNHAIRHELLDRNPITKVRTSGKRMREPDVLTPAEFASLVAEPDRGQDDRVAQFRHSLARNLSTTGVDLKTAQELLRYANSRITLDV